MATRMIRKNGYLQTQTLTSAYEKRLNAIRDAAEKEIQKVCDDIRANLIIPFCDKRNMHFVAGMGSWSFTSPLGASIGTWNADELPQRLSDALALSYPLNPTVQDIGSIIDDYKPVNFRRIV